MPRQKCRFARGAKLDWLRGEALLPQGAREVKVNQLHMKAHNPVILIIEDDKNDQLMIERGFKAAGVVTPIHIVNNGHEALCYLKGEGEFHDRERFPFPTTILTDLKMPVMDGFEVLKVLKDHPHWAVIPTIVLTASSDLDDIKKSYMLGASAVHTKPSELDELRELLKNLTDYWAWVEVPESNEAGEMLETDSVGKMSEALFHLK